MQTSAQAGAGLTSPYRRVKVHFRFRGYQEMLEYLEVPALDAACTSGRKRAHAFQRVDVVDILPGSTSDRSHNLTTNRKRSCNILCSGALDVGGLIFCSYHEHREYSR